MGCSWSELSPGASGGLLLCVTIIGIPFGIACWKMIPLALVPLGRQVVPISSAARDPYGVPGPSAPVA